MQSASPRLFMPPRQNHLDIAIEAGEQTYHAGGETKDLVR